VIDVLRATSTAAVLLGRGAPALDVAAQLDDLVVAAGARIVSELPEAAARGERIDNSPAAAGALVLDGRPLALVTTNGTRALLAASAAAPRVLAACFLNLGATVRALEAIGPARVVLVPAGDFASGAPHGEDERCADALSALLAGTPGDPASLAASCRDDERVKRRLAREPGLASDLALCLEIDRYPVAIEFLRGAGQTGRLVACAG
jgi:phosphosulfolactate phosphohydrolase-like enzyme